MCLTVTSATLPADPLGTSKKEASSGRHSSPAAGIGVDVGGTATVVSRTLTASPATHEEVRGIDLEVSPAASSNLTTSPLERPCTEPVPIDYWLDSEQHAPPVLIGFAGPTIVRAIQDLKELLLSRS